MTSADIAAWVAAAGTWVIGGGGIGALIYAGRAWRDQQRQLAAQSSEIAAQTKQLAIQSEQLELAREDSRRLRTPVLRAELSSVGQGVPNFRLDVWLSSSERLARTQVIIIEARPHDCPVGFTPGQWGVAQHPDQDSVPPGWRDDTLRHEAVWDQWLLPGTPATFQMAYREQLWAHSIPADPAKIQLRAECSAVSGEPWLVGVPVTVTPAAAQVLRDASGPDLTKTVR